MRRSPCRRIRRMLRLSGSFTAPTLPAGSARGGGWLRAARKDRKTLLCLTAQGRRSESRRRRNHEPPKSGIPKRKKTATHNRLSCKIEYLLRSNHGDISIASEFFTGDQFGHNHTAQTFRSRSRPCARRSSRRSPTCCASLKQRRPARPFSSSARNLEGEGGLRNERPTSRKPTNHLVPRTGSIYSDLRRYTTLVDTRF